MITDISPAVDDPSDNSWPMTNNQISVTARWWRIWMTFLHAPTAASTNLHSTLKSWIIKVYRELCFTFIFLYSDCWRSCHDDDTLLSYGWFSLQLPSHWSAIAAIVNSTLIYSIPQDLSSQLHRHVDIQLTFNFASNLSLSYKPDKLTHWHRHSLTVNINAPHATPIMSVIVAALWITPSKYKVRVLSL